MEVFVVSRKYNKAQESLSNVICLTRKHVQKIYMNNKFGHNCFLFVWLPHGQRTKFKIIDVIFLFPFVSVFWPIRNELDSSICLTSSNYIIIFSCFHCSGFETGQMYVSVHFDPTLCSVEVVIHGSNVTSNADPSKINFRHMSSVRMYVSKLLTHHLGLIKQCQSCWLQENKIVRISSNIFPETFLQTLVA